MIGEKYNQNYSIVFLFISLSQSERIYKLENRTNVVSYIMRRIPEKG